MTDYTTGELVYIPIMAANGVVVGYGGGIVYIEITNDRDNIVSLPVAAVIKMQSGTNGCKARYEATNFRRRTQQI